MGGTPDEGDDDPGADAVGVGDDLTDEAAEGNGGPLALTVPEAGAGARLDKALALAAAGIPGLSRSRLGQLLEAGAVRDAEGRPVADLRAKAEAGAVYRVEVPPPLPALPEPEPIPLTILHEDAHLIVVDKPAGMVVHPAPGAETGTLVNALLHHCGPDFAGIGGRARPGIVHRIDKETSGVLVVAKTEAAHAGLSAQFAAHSIDRRYLAVLWGAPDRADPRLAGLPATSFEAEGWIRIDAPLARHPTDRKRMAVRAGGRHAVTRLRAVERFEDSAGTAVACLAECRLETGRTHQIRVHAAHIGHPLLGDPTYGRARALSEDRVPEAARAAIAAFPRQALHAESLGFEHPVTGARVEAVSALPADLAGLLAALRGR